jgi:hypothetical protein
MNLFWQASVLKKVNSYEVIAMETIKLSKLVMAVSPELYDLLTEAERDSEIVVQGDINRLGEEDINYIIEKTIAHHHQDTPYH